MRIVGPNGPIAGGAASGARKPSSSSFSLPDAESRPTTSGVQTPRSVGGIDALLALQEVDSTEERRKRAVKKGRVALDVLDELKIGLLSGELTIGTLARLKSAAAGLKDPSGDPGLDGVLAEIDLRVEVELAKIQATPASA